MSEHITHIAVFEDAARLALHSGKLAAPLASSLKNNWRIGRLGACTRSGDAFSVGLLKKWREEWPGKPEDRLEHKMAFLLGWRCHQAGDRRFKPVYREVQPEHYAAKAAAGGESDPPSDATIYHDAVIFREVYGSGTQDPFTPSTLDYSVDDTVERVFRSSWHRTLLSGQKFLKDDGDAEAWLKLLFARIEPFNVNPKQYAAAFHDPDPSWLYRFIEAPNFYNRTDPVVRLARSIQQGKPDTSIDVEKAVTGWKGQCQYAQSVAMGYDMMMATTEFFERKIEEAELKKRYLIGVSHLQTKWG